MAAKNLERDLLILREYLKGRSFVSIANGTGLSPSRPQQIVNKYILVLRRFTQLEGEEIASEQNWERYRHPEKHTTYWQAVQARYEAKHSVCTINATIPEVAAPPVGLRGEEKAEKERLNRLRSFEWYRRRMRGESNRDIALASGAHVSTISYAIGVVRNKITMHIRKKHNLPLYACQLQHDRLWEESLNDLIQEATEATSDLLKDPA